MSSRAKVKVGFNPVQIKDGWVVRINKNGTIKSKIEPYPRPKESK